MTERFAGNVLGFALPIAARRSVDAARFLAEEALAMIGTSADLY